MKQKQETHKHELIIKYSEVLGREAEYCIGCQKFIW